MNSFLSIRNARLHNLKNISLDIPKNKLVVLTGISGSGKSTLAFDILHKESMRQYMESLGMISFGLTRPPVDSISGLSPSIAIDQHLTNHSPRSTVGTITDVFTYLRVLYARLGHRPCFKCGKDVPPPTSDLSENGLLEDESDESPDGTFPCPHCGVPMPEMGMANFSFNKPAGACPTCTGLGEIRQVIVERLVDMNKSILEKPVEGWIDFHVTYFANILQSAGNYYGFSFEPNKIIRDYSPVEMDLFLYGTDSPQMHQHFPSKKPPVVTAKGKFEGVITNVQRRYVEHVDNPTYREKMDHLFSVRPCSDCQGTRLNSESRKVRIADVGIVEISKLPLDDLADWLQNLPDQFTPDEKRVAQPILQDLATRMDRLHEVGVGYLAIDRASPSLSAGEAQRLRLAALLGSGLTDVLYILDEPTIGLHQRDTQRLINTLRRLRDLGNTVLVVEHDLEFIKAADYLVDVGPGAGNNGGKIVAVGTPTEVARNKYSITGSYLMETKAIPVPLRYPITPGKEIRVVGAKKHNLKDLTVAIPLGLLVAVTGVSGSGKSSLIFGTLGTAAQQYLSGESKEELECNQITGWDQIDNVILIDQHHMGRLPRSNAATYSDIFTPIRDAFAATPDAKARQLKARHFSFNVPGGRCERCEGMGTLAVKMHFLPDVDVRCPTCRGRRFKSEILSVKFRGFDIAQILEMTIDEAFDLFKSIPSAASRLNILAEVGLGYLQLGQPTTTLSGGEAQRVKLSKELGRRSTGRTLYLLDEPTTGQHAADVESLIRVLRRLVEAGNSVVVVEHNLDIIKSVDWVIDLGPEGGAAGGYLVAEGTPEDVAKVDQSATGTWLKKLLHD